MAIKKTKNITSQNLFVSSELAHYVGFKGFRYSIDLVPELKQKQRFSTKILQKFTQN